MALPVARLEFMVTGVDVQTWSGRIARPALYTSD